MSSSKCLPPAVLHILLLWCKIGLTVVIATNGPPSPVRNLTCFSRSPTYGYCIWNNSDSLIKPTPNHTLERIYDNRDDWNKVNCGETSEGVDIDADNICYLEGTDDIRYRYRVVSTNELGSVVTNMTTPDTFSMYFDVVPYPPHDIILQAETSTSLHVTWNPPSEFAGRKDCRVLGYKIRYKNSKDSEWIDELKFNRHTVGLDICAPSYTINDPALSPPYSIACIQLATEPYLANIHRQTDKVWSEWSQIKCTRLLEEKPNKEPGDLKTIISKNQENRQLINVLLTWEPLPVDRQNGKILGYNIGVTGRLDSHVTSNKTTYSAPENATWLFITDLNRAFQYTIDIVAFNSAGSSPKATIDIQPSPIKAPESKPASFTEVRFKNEKSRKMINVHLSWKPVPQNKQNDTILGYNITVNGHINSDTKNWRTYLVPANATNFIIPDLNKTYFYTIDIVAFNEGGNSPKAIIFIEPTPIKNNLLIIITVVVTVLLVAVILIIIFFCFWRKLSQQKEFEVQLPSIVKRSNYYTNTVHTLFRYTQEPEQFDELSERSSSPCCIDISENETNCERHVAVNVYQNFLGDLVESADFNHVVDGFTCDDAVKETTSLASVCVDHNGLSSGETEADEEICYLSMTPQGLSPLRKCKENHSDDDSDSNVVNETTAFTMMVLNGSDASKFESLHRTPKFGSNKSCGEVHPYVKQGINPVYSQKNCDEPEAVIETSIVENPKISNDNKAKMSHLTQILIPCNKVPEKNAKPGRTSGYVMRNHQIEVGAMSAAAKQLRNALINFDQEKHSIGQDKEIKCNLTSSHGNPASQIVHDGECCTDKEDSIIIEQNEDKSMFNTDVDHLDLKDETRCKLGLDLNLVELKISTEVQTGDSIVAFSKACGISEDLPGDKCSNNSQGGSVDQSTFEKDQLNRMGSCHAKPVKRFKNGDQLESTDSGIDIPNISFCDGDLFPNRTVIDPGEVNSRIKVNPDSIGVTVKDECQANSGKDDSNHNTHSCHNNLQSVRYPCASNTGYLRLASLKDGHPPSIKTPDDGYSSSNNSSPPDSPTEVLPNKMSG